MYKLVVLSALFAAVAAKPGVLLSAPLVPTTYAGTVAAPVPAPLATTYVQHSSYYGSPAVYSDIAYSHFIKKRSAPFHSTYVAPSTYIANTPLAAPYTSTYVAAPITYTSTVLPSYVAPAHFIKKRSVTLTAPTSYIAPALPSTYVASAPLATTYSAAVLPSAAYYSTYPGYAAALPFIKK